MEIPSGHPSSPTQISTNSKELKTPHLELSQAAPQHKYPTSTHRNTNTSTQYPPRTPCITTQTKSSTSYTSQSLTHNAKSKSQTNETNNFRKHFFHHKP